MLSRCGKARLGRAARLLVCLTSTRASRQGPLLSLRAKDREAQLNDTFFPFIGPRTRHWNENGAKSFHCISNQPETSPVFQPSRWPNPARPRNRSCAENTHSWSKVRPEKAPRLQVLIASAMDRKERRSRVAPLLGGDSRRLRSELRPHKEYLSARKDLLGEKLSKMWRLKDAKDAVVLNNRTEWMAEMRRKRENTVLKNLGMLLDQTVARPRKSSFNVRTGGTRNNPGKLETLFRSLKRDGQHYLCTHAPANIFRITLKQRNLSGLRGTEAPRKEDIWLPSTRRDNSEVTLSRSDSDSDVGF